jgi:hypothetical protein
MIFVYTDDDSKIFRNTFPIFWNINIICSKVVLEIANIVNIIKGKYLFRLILKIFSKVYL